VIVAADGDVGPGVATVCAAVVVAGCDEVRIVASVGPAFERPRLVDTCGATGGAGTVTGCVAGATAVVIVCLI
jgi:hypothetical protein